MARHIDLNKRAAELREMLQKYGGMPSQYVDRIAYAAIKYHVTHHADIPCIKELIDEFSLQDVGKDKNGVENKLQKFSAILERAGSIQDLRFNKTEYNTIFRYITTHIKDERCLFIAYKYGFNKYIQIPDSKFERRGDYYDIYLPTHVYTWKMNVTIENIEWGFNKFGEVPSDKSLQMRFLLEIEKHILQNHRAWLQYIDINKFYDFIDELIANGAVSDVLASIHMRRQL